ncbi:MAG: cell division protein FtsQ/DivIB [Thermoleophilaceae bacterium]
MKRAPEDQRGGRLRSARAGARPGPPVAPRLRRRAALLGAVLLCLLAVYGLWLRDSSLVRVERVTVTGLTGPDAPRYRAALTRRARSMTTLNLRRPELERAVGAHPAYRALEVDPRLPHEVEIHVIEHRPVARLAGARGRGALVAEDGTVLAGASTGRPLPSLDLPSGAARARPRSRIADPRAMRSVRALAAAPPLLVPEIAGALEGRERGMVVRLRAGPEVVLGDGRALAAKWASATRVLADGAARGASYVDVRLPDRPAAGGLDEPTEETKVADPPSEAETASGALQPEPQPPLEP